MPGEEELRVPPMPDPEMAEQGHAALERMRANAQIYEGLLNALGAQLPERLREIHVEAVKGLVKQLEHLHAGFEIVLGKREPSAAERAGRQ